jgi:divalent metal cation (Fe/Co/Zn/Cd) transporter
VDVYLRPFMHGPAGLVSLAVVASAAVVALGLNIADPLIGLTITIVILRITWDSWRTISTGDEHHRRH